MGGFALSTVTNVSRLIEATLDDPEMVRLLEAVERAEERLMGRG